MGPPIDTRRADGDSKDLAVVCPEPGETSGGARSDQWGAPRHDRVRDGPTRSTRHGPPATSPGPAPARHSFKGKALRVWSVCPAQCISQWVGGSQSSQDIIPLQSLTFAILVLSSCQHLFSFLLVPRNRIGRSKKNGGYIHPWNAALGAWKLFHVADHCGRRHKLLIERCRGLSVPHALLEETAGESAYLTRWRLWPVCFDCLFTLALNVA